MASNTFCRQIGTYANVSALESPGLASSPRSSPPRRCKSRKSECLFTRGEIQIDEEERVIGDPAEGAVGDLAFPMLFGASGDARIKHRQRCFELAVEGL